MGKILFMITIIMLAIFSNACTDNKKSEVGLYDQLSPQSLHFKENRSSKELENIGKLRILDGLAEAVYFKVNGKDSVIDGNVDAETKATTFHDAGETLRKLEAKRDSHPHDIKMSKDVVELYFVSAVRQKGEIPEIMMKTFILDDKVISYNEWEYLRVDIPTDDRLYYGTYLVKVYDDKFDADQSNTGREGKSGLVGTAKWDSSDMSVTYTLEVKVDGVPTTIEAKYKYKRVYVDYEAYASKFYNKGYKNYHFGNK